MKNIFTLILFIATTSSTAAQFGLRIAAQQNDYSNWKTIMNSAATPVNTNVFGTSAELGMDYWFRLKNVRLEFYPEIGIGYSSTSNTTNQNDIVPIFYKMKKVYGGLNLHLYFLDLKNDCNCPTFSKQNDFFKKGLFLLVKSRLHFQNKETIFTNNTISNNDIPLEFGAGLGLDIGISDLITISPFASASYFPSTRWDGISVNHGIINVLPPDETTSNLSFQFGIRVGFRPDYLNKR